MNNNDRQLKILHVFDHSIPQHSGYSFRSLAIIREQQNIGWKLYNLTSTKHPRDNKDLYEEYDGIGFYRTLPGNSFLNNLPVINQYMVIADLKARLRELVPDLRPDIIHVHSPSLNGLAAIPVIKKYHIPFIYEMRASWEDAAVNHGTTTEGSLRYKYSRHLETKVLVHADEIITICNGLKKDIIRRGIPEQKVTVVGNAIDHGRFKMRTHVNEALKARHDLSNKKIIGFIGSFYRYEGLDLLIEAFSQICDAVKDIRLVLIGGGPDENRLKSLVDTYGLARNVLFLGRIPHDSINEYYEIFDILIYPRESIRLTEIVTPLKPLEAMAKGVNIIASRIGGHQELIVDGITGILFEPGDSKDLCNKVIRNLDNQTELENMKQTAMNFVNTERTWQKVVSNYIPVYQRCLHNKE